MAIRAPDGAYNYVRVEHKPIGFSKDLLEIMCTINCQDSIMKNHLPKHMPGTKVRCLRCICGKQRRTYLHRSCISSSVISVSSHIEIESNHCEESTYAGFDHTSQSRGRIYICRVWWKRSHPNHYPDHSHQSEARGILRPNHASSQQGNLSGFPLNISCVPFYFTSSFNFVTFTFSSPKTTHLVPNLSSICLTLQITPLSSLVSSVAVLP